MGNNDNNKIVISGLTEEQKKTILKVLSQAEKDGVITFAFACESEEPDIIPDVLKLAQQAFAQTNWLR